MDEWLKIIGALGGLEAIRFIVTFLANRKTNARKEKLQQILWSSKIYFLSLTT